mgnify:CR=1 FL=1
MKVDINPKILTWAREERGMSAEDVAGKLKFDVSDLRQWELDGKDIHFGSLESVAKLYKRQTAVFFLPEVPAKVRKPKDCRNLAVNGGSFSPETMLAVRRTERYLQVARDLSGTLYWNGQYEWIKNFTGKEANLEKEINLLKEFLEINDVGNSSRRSDVAFRDWRTKIEEKLGIFVFQFPMQENELDGFSYAFEEFPYAIVINNQNPPVRKIFTLFHELGHMLKHNPGACKTDYSTESNQLAIELECNNFAGKFLVPAEHLKATTSVDEIFELAGRLNISGEVYLRRLSEEQKISKSKFFEILELVRERSNSFKKKKEKGAPSMIIQSKSTRGNKFFNSVTTGATNGKMSYSAASDLLGLKVGNIRL